MAIFSKTRENFQFLFPPSASADESGSKHIFELFRRYCVMAIGTVVLVSVCIFINSLTWKRVDAIQAELFPEGLSGYIFWGRLGCILNWIGLFVLAQHAVRASEGVQKEWVRRLQTPRLLEPRGGAVEFPQLPFDESQQVQDIRVGRIRGQDLPAHLLCLDQSPGLMMLHGEFKCVLHLPILRFAIRAADLEHLPH